MVNPHVSLSEISEEFSRSELEHNQVTVGLSRHQARSIRTSMIKLSGGKKKENARFFQQHGNGTENV
jgi:hypothetical protein